MIQVHLSEEEKTLFKLDPTKKSNFLKLLENKLKSEIIGQNESIDALVDAMSRLSAGIRNREKPILTLLFLGPTGVGKTETIKVLADFFFGKRTCFTRVNCQELAESHSVSKLFGSPPGYVGADIEPLLSQENLDKFCQNAFETGNGVFGLKDTSFAKRIMDDGKPISIVLFDEVEKAHQKVHTALLGIMDDGHLILANNKKVDFTNSIIIMTTNIGSKEIDTSLKDAPIGFNIGKDINSDIKEKAVDEAKNHFPPEFINRFDGLIAFNSLSRENIRNIIDIQLTRVQRDIFRSQIPITLEYKFGFMDELLNSGWSTQYGARQLNRVIQTILLTPISKMMSSDQLIGGDVVEIDYYDGSTHFLRKPRTHEQVVSWKTITDDFPPISNAPKSNGGAIKARAKRKGKSLDAK